MADNNGIWECPTCKTKAKVTGRNVEVFALPTLRPMWPIHYDCELANDIDHVDFSKLTKIG